MWMGDREFKELKENTVHLVMRRGPHFNVAFNSCCVLQTSEAALSKYVSTKAVLTTVMLQHFQVTEEVRLLR
jgi:hypothetical protein